jgi:hypothetical protein
MVVLLVYFTTLYKLHSLEVTEITVNVWTGNDMELTVACFKNYYMGLLLCYLTTLFQLQKLCSAE